MGGGIELINTPTGTAAASSTGCPYPHATAGVRRSPADLFVRRMLRIPDHPGPASARSAVTAFRRSMLVSTVRCSLTYLVFPFVLPALGLVTETGVLIGIVIGVLAITCDIFAIRRFFSVDHKWRWHFTTIVAGVVCLLTVLLVGDIVQVLT